MIADFLITSYIYEYCGDLTPGQLTDLRSSLVNNNTFGALAVRLQLHRHLLHHSQRLLDATYTFVTYQCSKNYEIHGNEVRKEIILSIRVILIVERAPIFHFAADDID